MASMVTEVGAQLSPRTLAEKELVVRPRSLMAAVAVSGGTTCDCGQALDCCHAQHCPRCGVTLPA